MEEIMVSAATGVMNSLLSKLTVLLAKEYKLQKKVKSDIGSMELELRSMSALLVSLAEMEDKGELDQPTKEWRNQVREQAYDMEDIIDNFMCRLQIEPSQVGCGVKVFICKWFNKLKEHQARRGISDQIEELKVQIKKTYERRTMYHIDGAVGVRCSVSMNHVEQVDPRVNFIFEEATSLVGIDGPRDDLMKMMVDDGDCQAQLKVVSIVGLAGLGKTTLANQVYQNLSGKFEYRAFVSLSRIPDRTKILRDILRQIKMEDLRGIQTWDESRLIEEHRKFPRYALSESSPPGRMKVLQDLIKIKEEECKDIDSWDEGRLISELKECLKDKRYLVVIDDIWNIDDWRNIKYALPDGNYGSRIITTTRHIDVAESCCVHIRDVYHLNGLNEADSEHLFFKRTFRYEDGYLPHLKNVSIDIVKKCAGLPLAIITMASLLSNKPKTMEEWKAVRDSIGSGLLGDHSIKQMNKILSLSYVDLPGHLRTCLLYLSIFPEDYVIRRDRLIKRWIAEGFIKSPCGTNLEREGESYFNDLINRSMIQPVGINYNGQVKACRVHDMILELIKSKAKEINFVTLINPIDVQAPQFKVRRLSIDCREQQRTTVSSMDRLLKDKSSMDISTRSLSIFGNCQHTFLSVKSSALRVLDVEGHLSMDNLMNIGKLLQLRYLRLSARSIEELPENIGQLKFLETLDVKETGIGALPAKVVLLYNLKHLLVNRVKFPAGVGNMRSLEKLSGFLLDDSCPATSLQELGSLTSLRFLGLRWSISNSHSEIAIHKDNLVSSLCRTDRYNLRVLRVRGDEYVGGYHEFTFDSCFRPSELLQEFTLYPNCYLCTIPRWMASLTNLTYLDIGINPVEQEALVIFGRLPTLIFLVLSSNKMVPKGLKISTGMFPCLKVFQLYCHDIETWLMFEAGAMKNIEKLEVPFRAQSSTCSTYDITMGHLSSLQDLNVRISCKGADEAGVTALEAAISKAASQLPKRPTPHFSRYFENEMVYDAKEGQSTEHAPTYPPPCDDPVPVPLPYPPYTIYHYKMNSGMEYHGLEENPNACAIC